MNITFRDDGAPLVYSLANGYLACHAHSTLWCADIQEVIEAGLDAESIFEEANNLFENAGFQLELMVPLVPTRDILTIVILSPVFRGGKRLGSYSAYILEGEPGTDIHEDGLDYRATLDFEKGNPSLGLLNPGEGRLVLRQMVIDWFYPESLIERGCLWPKHNSHTTLKLHNLIKADRGTEFANNWCLFTYRKCLLCQQDYPGLKIDWDDELIPLP